MKKDNSMMAAIAAISVLSVFLFSQEEPEKLSPGGFLLLILIAAGVNGYCLVRKKSRENRRLVLLCSCMGIFTAGLIVLAGKLKYHGEEYPGIIVWEGIIVFLAVLGWCFVCLRAEGGVTENTVLLILFGGFLIRVFYVVLTQSHILQNDLGNLAPDDYGHMGYVYYIYANGRIPDLNPMDYYQYYQPPLHHAVCAALLKIFGFFGFGLQEGQELLQIPAVLYGTMALFFVNKIGLRLRLPVAGRAVGLGFAAFLPFGIMSGGALNNDGLMQLLMVMALYFTMVWYENPGYKEIILMAVCIGCSMMAKLSGALAAPAMAILMLWKAWQDRAHVKVYVKQFLCFGLIAFPLGLWYSVLRYIQFRMPFGFISTLPIDVEQFVGGHMGWARFLDFSQAFQSLSLRWGGREGADYNIPVTMVKYAVFGEADCYRINSVLYITGTGLFWATFLLGILMAVAFAVWMVRRGNTVLEKTFVAAIVVFSMFSYVKFNLMYPFVCTMNLRYIQVALYLCLMILGAAAAEMVENSSPADCDVNLSAGNFQTCSNRLKIFRAAAVGFVGAYMAGAVVLIVQLDQLVH